MKFIGITLLLFCLAVPVLAEDDADAVKTTVSAFMVKQLPADESPSSDMNGTTVLLELTSANEAGFVTGVEIDRSKVSFKDSTGKDLFAAGKAARQAYDKKSRSFGGMREVENSLSVNLPRWIGRDKVRPGVVYLRCHALTTLSEDAAGVRIKGEVDVYMASEKTQTATITKAQLTAKDGFKLGASSVALQGFGGGLIDGRSYSVYEVATRARILKVEVVGNHGDASPVVLEGRGLRVYGDELADGDKIEITYAVPKRTTLELDLGVTPASVGQ